MELWEDKLVPFQVWGFPFSGDHDGGLLVGVSGG